MVYPQNLLSHEFSLLNTYRRVSRTGGSRSEFCLHIMLAIWAAWLESATHQSATSTNTLHWWLGDQECALLTLLCYRRWSLLLAFAIERPITVRTSWRPASSLFPLSLISTHFRVPRLRRYALLERMNSPEVQNASFCHVHVLHERFRGGKLESQRDCLSDRITSSLRGSCDARSLALPLHYLHVVC